MTHIRDSHSHLHRLLCPELGEPIVTTAVIHLCSTKRQYKAPVDPTMLGISIVHITGLIYLYRIGATIE